MGVIAGPRTNRAPAHALDVLRRLFGAEYAREFSIRLWDGTIVPAGERERFVFVVNTQYALRAAFAPPLDLNPGRAFVAGELEIEGSLEAAVDVLARAAGGIDVPAALALAGKVRRLPRPPKPSIDGIAHLAGARHSRKRDAAAIGFHYDQPLAFYRAFLDPDLIYSCAYFDDGIETLAEAQRAKLDYVLRKIRLQPGEELLDIGCGFGGLVIRAAQHGARALGITLSRRQYDEAQRRIAELGLGARARVELRDYRDLEAGTFDKIVSIGMVEHVGRERLPEYFTAAWRALRPGGFFMNHAIAEQSPERRGYRVRGFLGSYIFPDGDLLPVSQMLLAAERAGFEVRDVENLREHYARTLRAWLANLERNAAPAIDASGERTYRIWRLYLAGCAQGFASGRTSIFQALLARPDERGEAGLPATRRWLYQDEGR